MKRISLILAATIFAALGSVMEAADTAEQLYREAQRAYLAGDFERAKHDFQTLIEINPKFSNMRLSRGRRRAPSRPRQRKPLPFSNSPA
jgi:outer membrane protein assembly factor BamD (BamD/ComL family)